MRSFGEVNFKFFMIHRNMAWVADGVGLAGFFIAQDGSCFVDGLDEVEHIFDERCFGHPLSALSITSMKFYIRSVFITYNFAYG